MFEKQGERETTFHMSELLSLLRGLETDDLSTKTVEGQHFFIIYIVIIVRLVLLILHSHQAFVV